MLKAKLLHNKTETKNVNVVKMVKFIKTCGQYPRRFNFFKSIILPALSAGEKIDLQRTLFGRNG